jgi:hypothetical protein
VEVTQQPLPEALVLVPLAPSWVAARVAAAALVATLPLLLGVALPAAPAVLAVCARGAGFGRGRTTILTVSTLLRTAATSTPQGNPCRQARTTLQPS